MASQLEFSLQMIQQLRVLDPSMSAEVGTPERKLIDTVAQSLADNQVDLALLDGAFDLDAKFGTDLDKYLAIFGFGRQTGTQATGFITFRRTVVSNFDIAIPRGTQVIAPSVELDSGHTANFTYSVTESVTLTAGELSVVAPIRAILIGEVGNVAADTIVQFGRSPIPGISTLTNEVPTTGGIDAESDDELKIRFKNTVFRNLSGTNDQFLALAVSTLFTTKANVVGPISRYREYIQIPDVDDATADPDSGTPGNGPAGEYTSALSTIPYSKHVYDTVPYFVAADTFLGQRFYRQDLDFILNTAPLAKDKGDTYRGHTSGSDPNPTTAVSTTYQPNITFFSVYNGTDDSVDALRPQDVVLFEHSYMSSVSRNDYSRQILNCVDVFINGTNAVAADVVIPKPTGTSNVLTALAGDKFYIENFRRIGEPNHRPTIGNIFTPLYWQPVSDLPDTIETSDATYFKGTHYWAVEDVTTIGRTVRARSGIEWSTGVNGAVGDADEYPYTGPKITGTIDTSVTVQSYFYDRNIVDLQVAVEGNKQTTTDVLAHQAKHRRFKFDITVMYTTGVSRTDINARINDGLSTFFDGLYFGSVIQLSDILQEIHNVQGVDNVRWSKELLDARSLVVDTEGNTRDRVVEVTNDGDSLVNAIVDRRSAGGVTAEVQQFYVVGNPTGGTFRLALDGTLSNPISPGASAGTVNTALSATLPVAGVTGTGTPTDPYIVTFSGISGRSLLQSVPILQGGDTIYNSDFILQDDELPALPERSLATDSVAGLIIRPRAQNTWNQL